MKIEKLRSEGDSFFYDMQIQYHACMKNGYDPELREVKD